MKAISRIEDVATGVLNGEHYSVRHAIHDWHVDDLLDLAVAYGEEVVQRKRRARTLEAERHSTPAPRDRRPLRERLNPAQREEFDRRVEETDQRLNDRLRRIIDDYSVEMRAKWTRELLDAEIAMPDGTLTTWGEATVDQHRERYAMHERNAQAGIEGAARHRRAIADLELAGAPNLNHLVRDKEVQ